MSRSWVPRVLHTASGRNQHAIHPALHRCAVHRAGNSGRTRDARTDWRQKTRIHPSYGTQASLNSKMGDAWRSTPLLAWRVTRDIWLIAQASDLRTITTRLANGLLSPPSIHLGTSMTGTEVRNGSFASTTRPVDRADLAIYSSCGLPFARHTEGYNTCVKQCRPADATIRRKIILGVFLSDTAESLDNYA